MTQESSDDFADLVDAAQSSTEFWDNPIDDAEWNNAEPRSIRLAGEAP